VVRPRIVSVHANDVIAESDRVILRPWRLDEADRFFDMYRRMEVARWTGGRPMTDRAEAEPDIQWTLDQLAADPRFGWWAVVERARGVPAGTVLLKPLPDDDAIAVEIGWHLHPDSWGRGLATEAARVLLMRGFGLGLAEIWALTHPNNHRSVRVCEKIGMRLLGTTDRWDNETFLMFWIGARADQQPTLAADHPTSV
jgi:RimJ/RimL family protein N-acetyltransferase